MKKLVFLAVMAAGLVGCGESKKAQEAVKETLKDPTSAVFQNMKGACGEVNAKNSYGGYTGFKRFYVNNGTALTRDPEDSLDFDLGWIAHCESKTKLDSDGKDECVALGRFGAAVIRSKTAGVSIDKTRKTIKALDNSAEENAVYLDIAIDGYLAKQGETGYAIKVLNSCLDGVIKIPKS